MANQDKPDLEDKLRIAEIMLNQITHIMKGKPVQAQFYIMDAITAITTAAMPKELRGEILEMHIKNVNMIIEDIDARTAKNIITGNERNS